MPVLAEETSQVLPAYDQCIRRPIDLIFWIPGALFRRPSDKHISVAFEHWRNPARSWLKSRGRRTGRRRMAELLFELFRKRFRPACKNARRKICDA